MTPAEILTVVGLILTVALAFCGGMWGHAKWRQEREEKLRDELEAEQWERIEALETRDTDLRRWLRKAGIQTAMNEQPTPPTEGRLKRGPA